jgi:hypothetical protein
LGYDVSRTKIEGALKEAAIATGLTDPYVYITELGDYSVAYKIHGFLEDSSNFFSMSSLLNGKVMDKLHEKRIEIVSPTFMNQRRADDELFIPDTPKQKKTTEKTSTPEELIFDKAIKSEKIEQKKDFLKEIDKKQDELKEKIKDSSDKDEIENLKGSIKKNEELKDKIKESIRKHIEKDDTQK